MGCSSGDEPWLRWDEVRLLTVVVVLGGVDACRWRQDAMTPARRSLPPCTNVSATIEERELEGGEEGGARVWRWRGREMIKGDDSNDGSTL
ncbi:hypothetical protein YC2023_107838 [Brassica napus]